MEVVIGGQVYQMKLDAKGLLEVSCKAAGRNRDSAEAGDGRQRLWLGGY